MSSFKTLCFGCSCGFYQFLKLLRMAPITNAKKCYRYRQRHGDRYRKADVLRKKHNRTTMKTNDAVANEFCLKLQREKMREYRKSVSLEISQNFTSSSSTSLFSNKAVKGRSGKSKFVPIRYLLWTLTDLLEMVNGCSLVVEDGFDSFCDIFLKKLTFHQLYHFIKSRKQFVYNRDIPQASCLCEICENKVYTVNRFKSENELSCQPTFIG